MQSVILALDIDDILAFLLLPILGLGYLCGQRYWYKANPLEKQLFERRQQTVLGRKRQAREENADISLRIKKEEYDIVVLWGSQTGTAEGLAHTLARTLRQRLRLHAGVLDLADISPKSITSIPSDRPVVFLLSTYGEGDPTDNAVTFCRWLSQSQTTLKYLHYAAFGLGSSAYQHFNRTVTWVSESLADKGAIRIGSVGYGDAANGSTEETFLRWQDETVDALRAQFAYQEHPVVYEPSFLLSPVEQPEPTCTAFGEPYYVRSRTGMGLQRLPSSAPFELRFTNSRILNPQSRKPCLQLEIDISHHRNLKYATGDHLLLWPSNPDAEVERLLRLIGRQEDPARKQVFQINPSSENGKLETLLPNPCSLESLLRFYLAICAPVSKQVIQALAQVAPTTPIRDAIEVMRNGAGVTLRIKDSTHLTITDILEYFAREHSADHSTWHTIPLSWFLENIPRLRPRAYSISSSAAMSPRAISLAITLLDQEHSSKNCEAWRYGLTTDFVTTLNRSLHTVDGAHPTIPEYRPLVPSKDGVQGRLYGQLQRSRFKLPATPTVPIMMVAAGVGIAPFRAFVQERRQTALVGREVGETTLFYGCRGPDDLLFRDELDQSLAVPGFSLRMIPAFSRHPAPDRDKMYVQDAIRNHKQDVLQHILSDGHPLYVCGSTAMAQGVLTAVVEMIMESTGWDEARVRSWIQTRKRRGIWQEDVWG
jgi:NADPH-ferrihemoprotein reductase